MPTQLVIEAELEVARFLASQPVPEAIVAFRPSPATVERFYDLVAAQRGGLRASSAKETRMFVAHVSSLGPDKGGRDGCLSIRRMALHVQRCEGEMMGYLPRPAR
jgi:hypothetical protein